MRKADMADLYWPRAPSRNSRVVPAHRVDRPVHPRHHRVRRRRRGGRLGDRRVARPDRDADGARRGVHRHGLGHGPVGRFRGAVPDEAMSAGDVAIRANVVERLLAAADGGAQIAPITDADATFDVERAYETLADLHASRVAQGWRAVGRKIGFTNRTIWPRYGVDRPMWSMVWDRTI